MHLSALLQFPLTALLGSVDLFHGIKLHSLKYPPNNFMLTLCWNSQPTIYAFITLAHIFDTGLPTSLAILDMFIF